MVMMTLDERYPAERLQLTLLPGDVLTVLLGLMELRIKMAKNFAEDHPELMLLKDIADSISNRLLVPDKGERTNRLSKILLDWLQTLT